MKILFIACYSPLINNSASIETLQYLNNLAKIDGNEVHLLSVNFPKNSIYYDEYILSMLDKRVRKHIISGGKIFERIMPKKSQNTVVASAANSNKSFVKALLRKGRLKVKYEFKELCKEKVKALADKLGIEIPEIKPMPLCEIYNYQENNGNKSDKPIRKVGFSA